MTDIVVISLEVWDEVWRRNQHLVAGLARTGVVEKVLFVEPPIDTLHAIRSRTRSLGPRPGLREVDSGSFGNAQVWAYRPRKVLPRRIDPHGDRRRAARVAGVPQELGMRSPLLWVNDPGGAELLTVTGWPSLYDITDDWLLADRPPREQERITGQEEMLLAACEEVVVCSEALRRSKSKPVGREVVLIPNAVDVEPYLERQPRPRDLPNGRVVLYLGTAHRDRIDVQLCVQVARRLADSPHAPASLVLVGPAPLPDEDQQALTSAGVHVLGPRPSSQVPAYLQHADVLVVPHVLTPFTFSLDPIKAYEYRAARRPVVSTPVPGFVDVDDPLVRSVEATEFAAAVLSVLGSPVPWSPSLPADLPTWAQRAEQMAEVLARVETGAVGP